VSTARGRGQPTDPSSVGIGEPREAQNQALVERAAQPQGSAPAAQADPKLQRCRQIIKEWTLRDSRMSIDENGQPMK